MDLLLSLVFIIGIIVLLPILFFQRGIGIFRWRDGFFFAAGVGDTIDHFGGRANNRVVKNARSGAIVEVDDSDDELGLFERFGLHVSFRNDLVFLRTLSTRNLKFSVIETDIGDNEVPDGKRYKVTVVDAPFTYVPNRLQIAIFSRNAETSTNIPVMFCITTWVEVTNLRRFYTLQENPLQVLQAAAVELMRDFASFTKNDLPKYSQYTNGEVIENKEIGDLNENDKVLLAMFEDTKGQLHSQCEAAGFRIKDPAIYDISPAGEHAKELEKLLFERQRAKIERDAEKTRASAEAYKKKAIAKALASAGLGQENIAWALQSDAIEKTKVGTLYLPTSGRPAVAVG